ncbi:MAG: AraC family transcriptional regulator ligand-binding domain-containing protein [Desulfobacteraceae bacterium]|jgi:AraC-like DNA-binding protein
MKASNISASTMDVPMLIERLITHGIQQKEIEQTTGINPIKLNNFHFEVPLKNVIKLWEFTSKTTGDPALGIHLRKTQGNRYIHFVNYLAINSRTLLEAAHYYHRYGCLFCPVFAYDLRVDNNWAIFTFTITSAVHQNNWIPEYQLSFPIYLMNLNHNFPIIPKEIHFRHSCPTDEATYREFFKSAVLFEQEENAIIIKKEDLNFELPHRNPHLLSILKQQADIAYIRSSRMESFAHNVEGLIIKRISTGKLDIEMAAEELNMHRTTLHRKLKDSGTSFNQLLTDVRKHLSKFYIKQGMSIDQIAYFLGYSNRSGFQYAFKRWFGYTPGEYRRRI